jgi:hypothetical protein
MVTGMTVAVPALGVMVIFPVYVPFVRVAALAETVRVAGVVGVTVKLPLVIWAPRKEGESDVILVIATLLPVVDKVTFCDVAPCPAKALNVRLAGAATSVPLPPPPPGEYVTTTVTGVLPVALSVTFAVQGIVPQLEFLSWKYKVSGVVKPVVLKVFSQKGTPETVYVTGFVPAAVTWIDRAWLSFRPTVVELTVSCCASAGPAISSAVARNKAVFFSDL